MLSVVVPVYNEAESLSTLGRELAEALGPLGDSEILFVDDGSRDGSWAEIRAMAKADPRVKGLRFRRNFGKAAALSAGFEAANGDVCLTLDADLQDDPAEIGKFLEALDGGFDVVSGWKQVRHDPWHKVWPSRVFNAMASAITGCRLHDHNCGFKAYRRAVLDEVGLLYGERHRFIPVLAHAKGFQVGEVVINHRPRRFGISKYGVSRFLKGFLDLLSVRFLTHYGRRPLHLLGGVGLFLVAIGGLGLVYHAIAWLTGDQPIGPRPLFVYSSTALGVGVQLLSLGVLAELVTSYNIRPRDTYSIAETTDPNPSPEDRPDA